jgi:NAD binding domain of 6-phosphogluconate dehydrogenase
MQLGMIGLGRMGANMVRRLLRRGHQCVVFDRSAKAVEELAQEKAVGSASLGEMVRNLSTLRAVWLMVPAAVVDTTIADLLPYLEAEDILIDGGKSYYIDDIRRAKELAAKGIRSNFVRMRSCWQVPHLLVRGPHQWLEFRAPLHRMRSARYLRAIEDSATRIQPRCAVVPLCAKQETSPQKESSTRTWG